MADDYGAASDGELASDAAPSDRTPAAKTPRKLTKKQRDAILREARDRFEMVVSVDAENKSAADEDTRFVYTAGAQWPEAVRKTRETNGEACLEFPQLKQFVNQVVNDQRQKRPGVRIHPAGGKASKESAERLQGVIRGIEYGSNAEAAYDTAFQGAVVGGRGYVRLVTDWDSTQSFNQKLVIKRVADPATVWIDPDFQEPDASDISFAILTERVKKDDFESRWPDAQAVSWESGSAPTKWHPAKDEVTVADYYRRVCKSRILSVLSDGRTVYEDEVDVDALRAEGIEVEHSRDVREYKVEWHKIAGGEQILETFEWLGTTIPVFVCMGDEIIVDGKRIYQGLIRQTRDAQRMYNFEQTSKAQRLALAPKAPWVVAEESLGDHAHIWRTANTTPYSSLVYKAFSADGKPIPPPTRTAPAPMESGWAEAAQNSKADIKSIIGMYENSLGLHGQETSGRAIIAREKQGDNSTFHYVDNLARMIAALGRAIVELIPHYYDTQRTVTHIAQDDTRSAMEINKPVPGSEDPDDVENDVRTGQYAVTVEAGPSYATKRQETSEAMQNLIQSAPQIMQVAPDLVIKSLDFPDSDKLAERLKLSLPPQIQQAIQAEEAGQDPQLAAMAQQMQAQQQQFQQIASGMQKQLQESMAEVERLKSGDAVKLQIEEMKGEVAVLKGMFDIVKGTQSLQIAAQAATLAPIADAAVEPPQGQPPAPPQQAMPQQQAGPPQGMQ